MTVILGDIAAQLAMWGYAVTGPYDRLAAAWEEGHGDHPELWDRADADLDRSPDRKEPA